MLYKELHGSKTSVELITLADLRSSIHDIIGRSDPNLRMSPRSHKSKVLFGQDGELSLIHI